QAEIISIGTELLLGETVDTNAAYIARQLAGIGLNLFYKATVGDNAQRIAEVVRLALSRSDVVITTGGLGPTVDDVTREGIALATGRSLEMNPEALAQIEAIFARWGREPGENNRRQALIPAGAIVVENPVGTAPAFIVETERGTVISLPGVPREMKRLMETRVLPYLRKRLHSEEQVIKSRILHTCAIGESSLDARIEDLMRSENPTVGLAAHPGQTDIRITAKANHVAEADRLIADMEAQLRARVGEYIYGVEEETLEGVVAQLLADKGWSVILLETNTQGDIGHRLSEAAASGIPVLRQAIVADVKELAQLLNWESKAVDEMYPSVELGRAVVQELQRGDAEIALAVIGSFGKEEGFYAERTGETFVVMAQGGTILERRLPYGGIGELAQRWIGNWTLDMLRRWALGLPVH
ncbi:MAG TPA: CinA family nicotinamide mononucleotide deamidase-related protein, partial [Anaerolineae bacterium]|nr:CinA family nicotinamide mononucleotide deamidase-related protein [Anaerolineae bacterium]